MRRNRNWVAPSLYFKVREGAVLVVVVVLVVIVCRERDDRVGAGDQLITIFWSQHWIHYSFGILCDRCRCQVFMFDVCGMDGCQEK